MRDILWWKLLGCSDINHYDSGEASTKKTLMIGKIECFGSVDQNLSVNV